MSYLGRFIDVGPGHQERRRVEKKKRKHKAYEIGAEKGAQFKPNLFDLVIRVKNMRTIYFEKLKILIQLNNFLGVGLTTFFTTAHKCVQI